SSGLQEAELEFFDHSAAEGLVALLDILPVLAEQGALRQCEQLLGAAFPELARAGAAGRCHAALRAVAQRAAEARGPSAAEPFRGALVESLGQGAAPDL